jgi:hypothetical protein
MIIGNDSLPLAGRRRGTDRIPKAISQLGIPNGPSVGAERTGYPVSANVNEYSPHPDAGLFY